MFLGNLRLCLECQKENTVTGDLRVPSESLFFFSFQIWPFVGREGQIWGKAREILLGQRSSLKDLWMFPLQIGLGPPLRVLPKLDIMKSINSPKIYQAWTNWSQIFCQVSPGFKIPQLLKAGPGTWCLHQIPKSYVWISLYWLKASPSHSLRSYFHRSLFLDKPITLQILLI